MVYSFHTIVTVCVNLSKGITTMDKPADTAQIPAIEKAKIVEFCQRWHVSDLAIFGSVLRPDFGPFSDIDLLATFDDEVTWGLWDHIQMEHELETLLGREVDLINRRALERSANWLRRDAIIATAQSLYSSRDAHDESG